VTGVDDEQADDPDVAEINEWDAVAGEWDDSDAVRAYAAAAFESLERIAEANGMSLDGARIIDFGCGTGVLTERLVAAGADVLAIDNSSAMLLAVDRKIGERGWTTVSTSTDLPETDVRFDLVVCSSVCGFLDDYPAAVLDLASKLRAGGVFVQWDWERVDGDESEHGLSRSEIGDALRGAGLEQVEVGRDFVIDIEGEMVHPLLGTGRRPVDR
jgi:2-polyprenyl-3-methyl-5-hydroxy-6-metoxy-1,4-benzoquinol methylase